MAIAVQIIQKAKEEKLSVCIFGDYDADGVCATALLYDALSKYGLQVGTYTPERSEGYGLNKTAIKSIAETYQVLITVDLGITNHDEVRYAKELGLTVIVTDHHSLDNNQSPADAVLNPKLPDYPFDSLCGTGVAFKLVQALGFSWEQCEPWLELAAIATVADIVPLRDENRVLVSLGLQCITKKPTPGIAALIEISKLKTPITPDAFGFQIGPRLNAAGRMASPKTAVSLLLSHNEQDAHEKAAVLNELNAQRQIDQNKIVAEAMEQALRHDFVTNPLLIVKNEHWEKGLIGLAAGALCKQFGCPTAVFTLTDDKTGWVGSFRGIESTDIAACLLAAGAYAIKSGGHKMAGGATVSIEHFDTYCTLLQQEMKKIPIKEMVPLNEFDAEVNFQDLSLELAEEVAQLAPFGNGNPLPVFYTGSIHPIKGKCRICGKTQSHLQLALEQNQQTINAIGFGYASYLSRMPDTVDALYSLDINEFRGYRSLQLRIDELWSHDSETAIAGPKGLDSPETLLLTATDLFSWANRSKYLNSHIVFEEEDAAFAELKSIANTGDRGHLLITRCKDVAKWAVQFFGKNGFRPAVGESDQYLSLSTILFMPYSCCDSQTFPETSKHWHHIWLLDGDLISEEPALWAEHHPNAIIHVLSKKGASILANCLTDEEQQAIISSIQVCE